jgi:Uma2 family endonuclease
MAAKTPMSVEEYLRTSFDGPDREFLDGEVVERNAGEMSHSKVQARLIILLAELPRRTALHVFPGLRLRLGPSRIRIPDIAVFAGEEPLEDVPSTPPLVAIEIVSRDDRHTEILQKLGEYRQWGVPYIWLVDPWLRKIHSFSTAGLTEVAAFEIPEIGATIPASVIFA